MSEPILDYIFAPHALTGMQRRNITGSLVAEVIADPEQRVVVRPGRDVLQYRIDFGGTPHLVRVFVDVDRSPAEVVTACRTSKVAKYWRNEP